MHMYCLFCFIYVLVYYIVINVVVLLRQYTYTYIYTYTFYKGYPPSSHSPLRMVAYDKAKSEGVKNPCSHVAQMNLRGYYRCCFYKWSRARQAQQWTLVCSAAPKLAKRYKELPDVLRKLVGLKLKFRQKSSDQGASSATLPAGLTEVVSHCVVP